ncbi:putative fused ribosome-associated ATPase: ATP-binding protein; ATP-binding protein; membrane protein [Bradyrhizobium sp. STM 3843]|uniref:ribosome-associated ATPase/putative transporter RbbA n=1 Tax=Bradyrhizobium sp. STM 3843 TaxID=551947 RepID=UPI00024033C1|nr:ribosome-associated ATPase/putative transporter RbbA [Bradyrhizobium sp. STM 3843]CCE07700.1 putative fused ribosome-associated ATPase: ATP-binding protein; ATP-binding protein; membrane protein [Bradyrhizobium sp. STM 3843]
MTGTVIATVERVTHRYAKTFALDGLSLEIPARYMAGLIGPDGVGKSTLLALIAGVRKIQTGEVTVLDGDMADERHRQASYGRIAYMPQGLGRNLYPTLSVFDNIDFFGRLFGQGAAERRARINELLKATGLDPFGDRPCGKLSGGMKQKVSLCCSLMHDPDLLILDEPTTGVDPLSRRQFWELIDSIRLRRPQMSLIVATAYMDEASRFDWLAAMDDGKVIAQGAPKDILAKAGKTTLDNAFIALLPPDKRAQHQEVVVPPRSDSDDQAAAIEAEGLTRRFGDFVAVDHVSFRIGRGEIFGFLGSNGCGKTTTMKMMTGLLPVSEGSAKLFGRPMAADDMEARHNVGYMSQAFSLYGELTVRQNLELHAQLYHLPSNEIEGRIKELLARYDLEDIADAKPESLPLGDKQRLQLAVAVLHRPPMLILDEPTSGVDPVARDAFWRSLIELSRNDGVTIFLSTHFMNEAERCDRISLMHQGRVLAVGAPKELTRARGKETLEDAFIAYLEDAAERDQGKPAPTPQTVAPASATAPGAVQAIAPRRFDPGRMWAYARRETMELLRDPIRLAFAFVGPLVLMLAMGFGITFDVENLKYAAFDQDQTPESRRLLESFSGSHYFSEQPPISSSAELDRRMRSGELAVAVEIPSGFGRDVAGRHAPEAAFWIDGAMPFRGETAKGYVNGLLLRYAQDLATEQFGPNAPSTAYLGRIQIENRFRYNQAFKSVFSMIPSVVVIMLVLIPAVMASIGVGREKETGSIANFRSTPVSKLEFLLGKQFPYVLVGMLTFLLLVLMALIVFQVPVKGSFGALALGALLYVFATCGFGQFVSTFTRTQVAAVFATTILAIIPVVNFSGLLVPVSSLTGQGRLIGLIFPSAWFQPISVGTFTKGLGFSDLGLNMLMLAVFAIVYFVAAHLLLQKQET